MQIRVLSHKDLNQLVAFMKLSWQLAYPEFCQQEAALVDSLFEAKKIQGDLNDKTLIFLGAFKEQKLIGFTKLCIEKSRSFLDKIYVSQAYQRQGIGQKLLSASFDKVYEKGIISMGLEVEDTNHKAINFYKKNGFCLNPIKRLYPSTGPTLYYNCLMFCKDIKKSQAFGLLHQELSSTVSAQAFNTL